LDEPLWKRIPVMVPDVDARNLTPSSTALLSASLAVAGRREPKIVHGQVAAPTVTEVPVDGASRLPESSAARERRTAVPVVVGVQV
jgi:hypothetical protein